MRLIMLYGPPAVGKLTVAEELSKLTGIKVFHNHVTLDMAERFFEAFSRPFMKVVDGTRMLVFEAAAEHDLDLIFTLVYCARTDDPYIAQVRGIVEREGGEVCFVRLHAPESTLEERVVLEDRGRFGKLRSVERLRTMFTRYRMFEDIPETATLDLDTSTLTPSEAAQRIANHFGLVG